MRTARASRESSSPGRRRRCAPPSRPSRRAARAADFLLAHLRRGERLGRSWLDGRASGDAYLEDYAFVVAGLLDLYEASFDPRWLRESLALQAVLDRHYWDDAGGGYFRTA